VNFGEIVQYRIFL